MNLHDNQPLPPGTSVEVFSRFSASWITGFEIATSSDDRYDHYELRRRSDSAILPTTFAADDLRVEHAVTR